jgi:hypothetical protein
MYDDMREWWRHACVVLERHAASAASLLQRRGW